MFSLIVAISIACIILILVGRGKEAFMYLFTNGSIVIILLISVFCAAVFFDYLLYADDRKVEKERDSRVDAYENCVGPSDRFFSIADKYKREEECKRIHGVTDSDIYGSY